MMRGHQIKNEDYLPKLREVFVPAVNDPEPWRAVRWGSMELQVARLEVMADIVWNAQWTFTILDVGCGLGALVDHLELDYQKSAYHGIDIVEESIVAAKHKFKGIPKVAFETHDLRDEPRPADAVIASGTFTISNDEIFWSMLDAMWESAKVLMAFNVKSTWAPDDCASAGGISYLRDPAETLKECRERYTRNLKLDCSYLDHDFTIALYR